MGQARRLPTGVELRGFYEAALQFVDPCLPLDASLEEITAAASRRQAALARHPLNRVRGEMQELAEALLFIERAHPQVRSELGGSEMKAQLAGAGAAPVKLLFETDYSAAAPSAAGLMPRQDGRGPGRRTRPPETAPAPRPRLGDVVGSVALKPEAQTRPAAIELPHAVRPEPARLPEDLAWPATAGLLLTLWQAWLALYAGWSVARLLAWPAPGYGLDLPAGALVGISVLGVVAAAGVALLARAYRVAVRRLALLVHLSAAACCVDLLAWYLAAKRWPGLIAYPGWGLAIALGLGWLIAWGAAALHDAREHSLAKAKAQRRC